MDHYDFIIGSGAGDDMLVLKIPPCGKRILLLERGEYLLCKNGKRRLADIFVDNQSTTIFIFADAGIMHSSRGM